MRRTMWERFGEIPGSGNGGAGDPPNESTELGKNIAVKTALWNAIKQKADSSIPADDAAVDSIT